MVVEDVNTINFIRDEKRLAVAREVIKDKELFIYVVAACISADNNYTVEQSQANTVILNDLLTVIEEEDPDNDLKDIVYTGRLITLAEREYMMNGDDDNE